MAKFFTSDTEFRAWSGSCPEGYVLNLRRNAGANYLILHKASCSSLSPSQYRGGAFTERSYRKVGSASIRELTDWIGKNVPGAASFSGRCGRCHP